MLRRVNIHTPLDAEIMGIRMVVGVVSMEEKGRMVGDDASDGHGYVVICASTFIDDALIRSEVNVAWTFILYNTCWIICLIDFFLQY